MEVELGLGLWRVDEGEGQPVIAVFKLQRARDLEAILAESPMT